MAAPKVVTNILQQFSQGRRKHIPPPFFCAKYGNRQTLPRPTAYPTVASKNVNLLSQFSRGSSPFSGLKMGFVSDFGSRNAALLDDFRITAYQQKKSDL